MKHPFRRGLLIASLTEIETEQDGIIRILHSLFDHILNVMDAVGTNLVNLFVSKKHRVPTLFPKYRKQQDANKPVVYTLPDGRTILIED